MKNGWEYIQNNIGQEELFAPRTKAEYVEMASGTSVEAALANNKLASWPVGSIYMSVNATSPAQLFGGTWVAWGAGRVPVGINAGDGDFNAVEKTGGAKTHALTASQLPSSIPLMYTNGTNGSYGAILASVAYLYGTNNGTFNASVVGGGGAHNNLQPYITCYMWKRTA